MIRGIIPADVAQLRKLLSELHQRSEYADLAPHWPTVFQVVSKASASSKGVVYVAENDGVLTGILIGVIQDYWWADPQTGPRVASDLLFYSKKVGDGKELMRKFIKWAMSKPRVQRIEVGISFGKASALKMDFYTNLGFSYSGPMFCMNVEDK